jgi:hypothetical protein
VNHGFHEMKGIINFFAVNEVFGVTGKMNEVLMTVNNICNTNKNILLSSTTYTEIS